MTQPVPTPQVYRLIRPDDQLELVITVRMAHVTGGDQPEIVADVVLPGGDPGTFDPHDGSLAVTFEPLHLVEWAQLGQPKPIFGNDSTVVFQLPHATRIPLSVAGVLAALPGLPLATFLGIRPALAPPAPPPTAASSAAVTADRAATDRAATDRAATDRASTEGALVERALVERVLADRASRAAAFVPRATAPQTAGGPRAGESRAGEPQAGEPRPERDAAGPGAVGPGAVDSLPPPPPPTAPFQTELNFPSRLTMSPRPGATRFVHAAEPVEHDGRTELWHTRLAVRRADGALVELPAEVPVLSTHELPSDLPDSAWKQRVSDEAVQNALDRNARVGLAAQAGDAAPPVAARLALSGLGAWLDVEGEWSSGTIRSWHQQLVMGRDQFVRTVAAGQLYPLGHRALLVQTTERQLSPRSGVPARLVTEQRIVVRDRDRSYTGMGDDIERSWPWQQVRLTTRITPDGDLETFATGAGQRVAQLLRVDGEPFAYRCEAIDRGGRPASFEMPLIFVPDQFGDLGPVETAYYNHKERDTDPVGDFRTVELRGQVVAVAPPGGSPDAADVVTHTVRLGTVSRFDPTRPAALRPLLEEIAGRVPAFDRFSAAAGPAALTLKYAGTYLKHEFGTGNAGEALLEIVPGPAVPAPVVDLARAALTGGLAGPKFDLVGLSRSLGPVGGILADLATGTVNPADLFKDLTGALRLFGVFSLQDLLGHQNLGLGHAPKMTTTANNGQVTSTFSWQSPLFTGVSPGAGVAPKVSVGTASGQLRRRRDPNDHEHNPPRDLEATLSLTVQTTVTGGQVRQHSTCRLDNLELVLGVSGTDLVVIPVQSITFDSVDGRKPDMDVNLGTVEFLGVLSFIGTLARLIPADAFHDPPALDIRPDGVTSSFTLPVPSVGVGIFSLENLSLSSRLDVFFAAAAPTLEVGFARRDSPFHLTVAALGGGGFVSVLLATDGLRNLEGSLEFGAALTVNLGVAAGSVSVMGGLYFQLAQLDGALQATIAAYLRVRGELRVLGLVSVSVELMLAMSYRPESGKVSGSAELSVRVSVLFFKKTVKIHFERTFAGGNADPTFTELMAHDEVPGQRAWDRYCLAFG